MSLTVNLGSSTTTVSTANVFFPLSWRLKVSLYDGNYTMGYKYKLMPGHVFTVGAGANLTIATLAVYTQAKLDEVTQPSNVPNTHYKNKTSIVDAQCVIEAGGKMTVSTAVGGKITISGGTFTNNGSTSVKSAEGKGYTLFGKWLYSTQDISFSLSTVQA